MDLPVDLIFKMPGREDILQQKLLQKPRELEFRNISFLAKTRPLPAKSMQEPLLTDQ